MKSGSSVVLFVVPLALCAAAWILFGSVVGAVALGLMLAMFAFNSAHIRYRVKQRWRDDLGKSTGADGAGLRQSRCSLDVLIPGE
jgi:hypothetical protein